MGADWLADEQALKTLSDQRLEFELDIRDIVLDKLTETVRVPTFS